MSHLHAYFLKRGRGSNEYAVFATPIELAPDVRGYERIKRDRALREARWTGQAPAYVTVTPCACGECALAQYADAHEHSALANRVRKARRELEQGMRDILGRNRMNRRSGEYEGELPRYEEGDG